MKKITILAAVVALLGSCAQNTEDTIKPNNKAEGRTIYATFDNDKATKTYVEDYKYLRWHAGDEISFFDATTYNNKYAFAGEDGDAEGEFNAVVTGSGETLAITYGVYPYNANTTISAEGVLSVELPAIQAYGVKSFGKGANTMVAVGESATDDKLFFKNACGYLVVKLYNENAVTVKSVVLKGNNEEKIAGSATITATYADVPSVATTDSATTSVTIDCGEGVEIGTTAETATEFWFALPETTFESGITITATDTEGKEFEKTTTKPVAITRNDIQPMKAIVAEFMATKPANNEIWYTNGSTTEATEPFDKTVFGATFLSNTYDSEKEYWVIKFDGTVTQIGSSAFINSSNITSVILPESVTSIWAYAFKGCRNLSYINIPNGVISIQREAFWACSALKNIEIPNSVQAIWDQAFSGCSSLENIIIGNGVSSFGSNIFSQSTGQLTIHCNIPGKSSEYRSQAAFYNNKFSKVIVGENVKYIRENAFSYSSNLKSVIIGNNVTTIDSYAFYYCSNLENISIGENVTNIGSYAFKGCSKLADVYCKPTTPPSLSSSSPVFANNASSLKIYVPSESVDSYKSNNNWRTYASYIVGYDFE